MGRIYGQPQESSVMAFFWRRNATSELESSMSSIQIGQKSYEMPPREGISIAHFLTVATSSDRLDTTKRSSALVF
jgi:hypothetical protein